MKYLKIILFFVVLVGGIFFVMRWVNGVVTPPPPQPGEPINPEEKCAEIRNVWDNEANWNEQLLKSQKRDFDQDNSLGRYEFPDDAETVLNTIRESATSKLCEAIFREFDSASCNDKLVTQNYAGVQVLSDMFGMENDERLQKVQRVKKVYDDITKFVNSKHIITTKFNPANFEKMWDSFSELSQGIINTADNFRKNTIYKAELSNIKRFIEGLNESYIRKVVYTQESTFYNDLYKQIIEHFEKLAENDATITEANLARYNMAYRKYCNESNLKEEREAMYEAKENFKKKYEEKLKRDETNN